MPHPWPREVTFFKVGRLENVGIEGGKATPRSAKGLLLALCSGVTHNETQETICSTETPILG